MLSSYHIVSMQVHWESNVKKQQTSWSTRYTPWSTVFVQWTVSDTEFSENSETEEKKLAKLGWYPEFILHLALEFLYVRPKFVHISGPGISYPSKNHTVGLGYFHPKRNCCRPGMVSSRIYSSKYSISTIWQGPGLVLLG